MRILWIEDELLVQQKKDRLFGVFAKDHDVKIDGDFGSAYAKVTNHLRQYDVLAIDIDLTHSEKHQWISEVASQFSLTIDKFLKEAGFLIYLKALSQGFPHERMIFLTANMSPNEISKAVLNLRNAMDSPDAAVWNQAVDEVKRLLPSEQRPQFDKILDTQDENEIFTFWESWKGGATGEDYENTYEIFIKRFKDARITPPKAVDKKATDGGALELQNWLRRHCERPKDNPSDYDYLTLRRSILDVIADLQQSLTKDFQEHLDKDTFLKGLEWQLRDFALPREDYSNVYFALCDYLTKPYDIYNGRNLLEDPSRHLKLPLYHLKNWIAHGLIMGSKTQISAQAAGVTFLMAMTNLFDRKSYGFQDELKRLFSGETVTEGNLLDQIKTLVAGYAREYPILWGPHNAEGLLEVLFRLGEKTFYKDWPQENYLRHFYAAYLFSIQQPDRSIRKDADSELNAIVFHELNSQPHN
jgi:hypothetical protein